VHFALTLLQQGRRVCLLDVGYERLAPVRPADSLRQLKANLADPVDYFLGRNFECVTFPGAPGEYYGIPPGRAYVFREPAGFAAHSTGFSPLFSFARGGLAEAWTGGVYPFNDAGLRDFPFKHADIAPHYAEVARRIGINGEGDDLGRFMPLHEHMQSPLRLDRHSRKLIDRYYKVKSRLNTELGCWLGRSRLATLSEARKGRGACHYLGRCLWGCPVDALYTPSLTLAQCHEYPEFEYVPGTYVTHFTADAQQRVRRVHGFRIDGGDFDMSVDALVLAAGALSSSRIFLESVYRATGEILRLPGLMDNQQVLVPFVNLEMLGVRYEPESYQYHMLGMGLESADPSEYVHGQITTLKTTMAHPVIKSLPFDMRASTAAFRHIRSALGLVNVNFHDTRRNDCHVTLQPGNGKSMHLAIEYKARPGEADFVRQAVKRVRKALAKLRCFAPTSMMHVRPKGASVHYSGTLPMTDQGGSCTATPACVSRDFGNLVFADGATFPFLPAKNITFTLMANAVRAARIAFS
jgi:choline dehydrogenase-like flavoprotein